MSGIINIYLPMNVSAEARLLRYREQPVSLRLQNGTLVDATAELAIVADGDRMTFTIATRWAGQFYNVVVQPVTDLDAHWQRWAAIADTMAQTVLWEQAE